MIRISPYYDPKRANGEEILDLYLRTVAECVPFFPEDVLGKASDDPKCYNPRERYYKQNLNEYGKLLEEKEFDVKKGKSKEEKRKEDAILAEKLIKDYSQKLHQYLYGDNKIHDGHVIPQNLHNLLTFTMPDGVLPPELDLDDAKKKGSTEAKNLLKHVFRYEDFASSKNVYRLLELLGVDTCPYCNRQYTTTFRAGMKKSAAQTRPQLDHFKVKSHFPYLALSINNLVPSCAVCNLMKGEDTRETLYPYSEGMGDDYVFSTDIPEQRVAPVLTGARIAPELFNIKLDQAKDRNLSDGFIERAKNSAELFGLEGIYQSQKKYVADLYFQRYILTEDRVRDIANQFRTVFEEDLPPIDTSKPKDVIKAEEKRRIVHIENEVRSAMLLMNTESDAVGDRPLGKLTRDIRAEIEREYAKIPPKKR